MFKSKIAGIPCEIEVVSYSPEQAQTWTDPSWPAEAEFVVLDRRGRRAAWLERKMTRDDHVRIQREVVEFNEKKT